MQIRSYTDHMACIPTCGVPAAASVQVARTVLRNKSNGRLLPYSADQNTQEHRHQLDTAGWLHIRASGCIMLYHAAAVCVHVLSALRSAGVPSVHTTCNSSSTASMANASTAGGQ
jgi:hypothetical protein